MFIGYSRYLPIILSLINDSLIKHKTSINIKIIICNHYTCWLKIDKYNFRIILKIAKNIIKYLDVCTGMKRITLIEPIINTNE